MATEEDLDKSEEAVGSEGAEPSDTAEAPSDISSDSEISEIPIQLGYQRYVYAAFMAAALLTAFVIAKAGHAAWYRLSQWKPQIGEPQDEYVFPAAALIGVGLAVYYWRKPEARRYADEVAQELSKVTWPSRKEVTNSTTVVVMTTLFATVFFALMDRFWSFITDKIYSF
jgi:preprotein translocase subunit SecE